MTFFMLQKELPDVYGHQARNRNTGGGCTARHDELKHLMCNACKSSGLRTLLEAKQLLTLFQNLLILPNQTFLVVTLFLFKLSYSVLSNCILITESGMNQVMLLHKFN